MDEHGPMEFGTVVQAARCHLHFQRCWLGHYRSAAPNHIAIWIVPGFAVLLIAYWYAIKSRDFAGPPSGTVSEERHAEILATERALDEAHASRNAAS